MQSGMLFNLGNTAPREEYHDSIWGETMSTLTPASSGIACNKTLIKTLVFMMLPLAGSGIDIYSPSLPYIQHYFSTTATFAQLTISLYLLGLCIGQLVFGSLSDAFGRKVTSIYGAVGFMLFSMLIIAAQSIMFILCMRLLQGFCIGAIAVNARSLITDVFSKQEIQKISAYMSLTWSFGPIIAPLLGGVFQYYISWKLSFIFLTFYALVLGAFISFIQETIPATKPLQFKTTITNYMRVMSHREFGGAFLIMAVGYSILMCYAIVLPFFVQNIMHKSSLFYGNSATIIGVSYSIGAIMNRALQKFISPSNIINYSLTCMLVLVMVMLAVNTLFTVSIVTLYAPILLLTICIAVIFPGCLAKCISLFPSMAGVASAVAGAGFIFVGAISSIIISHLHFNTAFEVAMAFTVLVLSAVIIRVLFEFKNLSAWVRKNP